MARKSTSFQKSLTRYEDYNKKSLVGEFPHSAIQTKIVYAIDGRNAWNSTWVTRYYPRTFSLSFDEAKRLVEPMRVQGSTWTIREIPAIAFIGKSVALIVSQINTSEILKEHSLDRGMKPFFNDLAEYFEPTHKSQIVRFICSDRDEIEAGGKYSRYKSYSQGAHYRLGWFKDCQSGLSYKSVKVWTKRFDELLSSQSYFGIVYVPHDDGGVGVESLLADSPLQGLDLKTGDRLISVESPEGQVQTIDKELPKLNPSARTKLRYERDGRKKSVSFLISSFKDIQSGRD